MKKLTTLFFIFLFPFLLKAQDVWQNYQHNGLASDYVYSIAIDADGNKWFGTNNGVSKFDGTNWVEIYNSGSIRNWLLGDYVQSIATDKDGNKWFGTSFNGVIKFDGTNWTKYA